MRASGSGDPGLDARHVLVVDDERLVTAAVERALRGLFVVEIAPGGDEALRRIRGGARYSLILCDLVMPIVTGLDLLDALRREAPALAARVVLMTAAIGAAELAGAGVPVLAKPLDRAGLVAVAARYHPVSSVSHAPWWSA
jgi:CheY-like chemotaxis protein